MVGNVWEWTEDCYHDSYNGAPADGSASRGDCGTPTLRGGSFYDNPGDLGSARRSRRTAEDRNDYSGFRVGRALLPP